MENHNLITKLLPEIPTPCYVIDERAIEKNAKRFFNLQQETGAECILALKAFASYSTFPTLTPYLSGTTASSLHEAKLGKTQFGKSCHIYAPAYNPTELPEILNYADHITFNSLTQWQRLRHLVENHKNKIEVGLRLNPEHSEVDIPMYDPCARHSRFGVTAKEFDVTALDGISGFHIHNLCGKGADSLERTLHALEKNFAPYFEKVSWLNIGGGHMLSRADYDREKLISLIKGLQNRYGLKIILEPGEGIVFEAGYLVTSVLDLMHNEKDIAIVDTSASAHMPDVLEMPYRPTILGASETGKHHIRIGGISCLSGDTIGDYNFENPLTIGEKLIFTDMAQYTIVKNTQFNGIRLPGIGRIKTDGTFELVREFNFDDYLNRLS